MAIHSSAIVPARKLGGGGSIQSCRLMSRFLAKLFIVVVMGNGLIANYAPDIGVNAGTLCIDVMCLVLLFVAIISEISSHQNIRSIIISAPVFIVFLVIAILTMVSVLAVGVYSRGLLSDLRIRFLYFLVAPSLYVLLRPSDVKSVFQFFIDCGVFFCIFAIVQFTFASVLDPKLLSVRYDGTLALSWSESTGSSVLRSNALMGNAIEFGGVAVMLFASALSEVFEHGANPTRIAKVTVIAVGCYFSYSRVACVALVVIFVALFFRMSRARGMNKFLRFIVLFALLGISLYILLGNSELVGRFMGSDEFTTSSNLAHANNTKKVLQAIGENPIFGTGLGTQLVSDTRSTADGWWFQLAAETGVFVLMLYAGLYIALGRELYASQGRDSGITEELSIVCLACLVYFLVVSFINSSFAGRADLTLFMTLVGLWLASLPNGPMFRGSTNRCKLD